MPEGEEMFKFHGYSGPCPGPRTKPMGGVPEVIELHGEKWVRIDVVRKQEQRLAAAEAALKEILDRAENDDVVSCIAIASKAIGLRMFVGNPPNSNDEAAKGGRDANSDREDS